MHLRLIAPLPARGTSLASAPTELVGSGAWWLLRVLVVTWVAFATPEAQALGTCGTGGPTGENLKVVFEDAYYRLFTPSGYTDEKPWPLLVELHGDEGSPEISAIPMWLPVWKQDSSYLWVSPKAPYANGLWYQDIDRHTVFMDHVIAKLAADYNVDIDRIWIMGGSGGACFLGGYAFQRQNIFAAVHYAQCACRAGSDNPPTPYCKIPARYVECPGDPYYEGTHAHYEKLKALGHEVEWVDAPCEGHKVYTGPGGATTSALEWLKRHTHCGGTTQDGCGKLGDLPGPPTADDGGAAGPAGDDGGAAGPAGDNAGGEARELAGHDASGDAVGGPRANTAAGSGCDLSHAPAASTWLLLALLALLAGRRSVRRTTCARRAHAILQRGFRPTGVREMSPRSPRARR
jgi:predicted esterase